LNPVWLLDLDDTLHDAISKIIPRINQRMTDFVAQELQIDRNRADALRREYWLRYGATLLGLIQRHQVEPGRFLQATHPMAELGPLVERDVRLIQALRRLPGRKIVLTNAPHHYAVEVLTRLGIHRSIDHLIPIESMRIAGHLRPKPSKLMLRAVLARHRLEPARCVLVEDSLSNLVSARALGLRTVLIHGFHRRAGLSPRWLAGPGRRVGAQVRSSHELTRLALRR
jgi:putative hydrolase of the HAD superfamily